MNYKIIGSSVFALFLGSAMLALSFYIGDDIKTISLSLTILVLAFAGGWFIGILISPYSRQEEEQFSTISKTASAFASGYLVGKVDKIIEKMTSPEFLLNPIAGFRLMAFVAAFTISMLITFVYRRYAP
jgi:hypothetical protein